MAEMFANVSTVRNVSSVLTQIRIDYGLGLGNYLALTDFSNLTFHPFYPDIRTQVCLDTEPPHIRTVPCCTRWT